MGLKVIIISIVVFTFVSCASKRKVDSNGAFASNKKVETILDSLIVTEANIPKTLTFKSNVSFNAEGKNTSLKTYVRMVPDSAIWISISAYSIEVARILAMPDSLSFLSKTDKKYYTGNYDFIFNKLGVKLGFVELQAVLLGHSIGAIGEAQIQKRNDKEFYVLSTHKKSQIKRLVNGKAVNTEGEIAYSNWVNSNTYQIEKVAMVDMSNQNSAHIHYASFEKNGPYHILKQLQMHIIAGKEITVEANNSKVIINQPTRMPFKISSKYEKML